MRDLPRRTASGLVYGLIVLAAALGPREIFVVAVGVMAALALRELSSLRSAGIAALCQLVVLALGAAALLFLRELAPFPFLPLLMTILAVWAADVVAYVVGSTFGRRRIAPRISPGKTWEGTIAGLLAAGVVVLIAGGPLPAAAVIGPAAFGGDLLESWVKRRAGVKDSGSLFPGHGGMLDRIDSLVAAAPAVAATFLAIFFAVRMG